MERRGPARLDPAAVPDWAEPFDPMVELDWAEPTTSRRLLREHLDQAHDGASRRLPEVDRHVRRLRRLLPPGPAPANILDAACGPGLYAVRLAAAGHRVTGTDVGPAVLEHARGLVRSEGVADRVRLARWDLSTPPPPRDIVPGSFDATLLVYWILEAFDAATQPVVLAHLAATLRPGGRLLMELRTRPGQPPGRLSHWERVERSLLSDAPHLLLTDTTWDPRRCEYVLREVAVLPGGRVAVQQTTGLLLPLDRVRRLVERAGLRVLAVHDGWSRYPADELSEVLLVVAERPAVTAGRPRRAGSSAAPGG